MELVYVKARISGMTLKMVKSIAITLSCTNREAFIITKADPFRYLILLKEYGIDASARPILRNRKIVGYKFKNAA